MSRGFDDLPPLNLASLTPADAEKLLGKVDDAKITKLVSELESAMAKAVSDREILATVLAAAQIAIKLLA